MSVLFLFIKKYIVIFGVGSVRSAYLVWSDDRILPKIEMFKVFLLHNILYLEMNIVYSMREFRAFIKIWLYSVPGIIFTFPSS